MSAASCSPSSRATASEARSSLLETGERIGGGVPEEATGQFDELVRRGRNKLLSLDGDVKVFAEWYGPPPRVFVYGAVDTAEALCRAAKLLGWTAIVGDARGDVPDAASGCRRPTC